MESVSRPYELSFRPEHAYDPGSADNPRRYRHELSLAPHEPARSCLGVRCLVGGHEEGSLLLASDHPLLASDGLAATKDDTLFLGAGTHLVALRLPSLEHLWTAPCDEVAVLGVHLVEHGTALVTHGELTVRRFTLTGAEAWRAEGSDAFFGDLRIEGDQVLVEDAVGVLHRFDLATGGGGPNGH